MFEEINKARKILGLDEEATIYEIKERYYEFSKKYHPDRSSQENKEENEKKFKQINWAYDIVMNYVALFRVSFKEQDVKKMSMDKYTYKHLKQFYDEWWGKLDM